MSHIIIRVYGKVQGVWFRDSTKEKADELGLSGFVQNEADGSVYIEVEGEGETLDELVKWCEKGPKLARVDRCEVEVGKEEVGLAGFEVRY